MPSDADMGNSEVGHNALGAGRMFAQGSKLVQHAIDNRRIFQTDLWKKLVERAKGVLGVQMGLSEPEAFRWIQKAAMDRRIGMVDVAKTILDQLEK
jgi:AmiR/NasT family two-component response regulator